MLVYQRVRTPFSYEELSHLLPAHRSSSEQWTERSATSDPWSYCRIREEVSSGECWKTPKNTQKDQCFAEKLWLQTFKFVKWKIVNYYRNMGVRFVPEIHCLWTLNLCFWRNAEALISWSPRTKPETGTQNSTNLWKLTWHCFPIPFSIGNTSS